MRSSVTRLLSRYVHTGGMKGGPAAGAAAVGLPQAATQGGAPGKKRGVVWWTAVAFGAGATIGVAMGVDQLRRARATVANTQDQNPIILQAVPDVPVSRSIKFPLDTSGLKLTLFQYQTCPFCCKVRAMLDFFGVSYDIVEVNPVMRTQMKWSQNYKKVPILIVQTPEGEIIQLNDSSMIVSALYSYIFANQSSTKGTADAEGENTLINISKCYPVINFNDESGKNQSEIMNKYFLMLDLNMGGRSKEDITEERKWRKWADSVYVHTLSPNIYRTWSEALDSFRYFDKVGEWEKNFTQWERAVIIYVGAAAMLMIGKRLQKRHNLKKDVRQSLFDESDFWVTSIKKRGGHFMGGKSPNLSDLAVYGVLSSIEGCQAFADLTGHSKGMADWYYRMKGQLKTQPNLA